jgi:hypothetical protein
MNNKPPLDSALLKKITVDHLVSFLTLLVLGAVHIGFGCMAIYVINGTTAKIVGCVFILAGTGVSIFNFYSTVSSIRYYYEKSLLKKYGREVLAKVTEKHIDEFFEKNNHSSSTKRPLAIERDYRIGFRYSFNGASYDSECFLNKQALYEILEIGQEIPILILPSKPDVAHPRIRKLTARIKTQKPKSTATPESDVVIGESLLDEENF